MFELEFEFEYYRKVLGYHKQMRSDAYTVPKGLKGKLVPYTLDEGTEVVFMPVGKAYQVNLKLGWQKKPVIVVHNGETGNGHWQADDFETGLLVVGYFQTRDAAMDAVFSELIDIGEKRYWENQKRLVKRLRKAKAPVNILEIAPDAANVHDRDYPQRTTQLSLI